MNDSRFWLQNLKHGGIPPERLYKFSLTYNSYLNSFFVESFVENEFIDVTKYSETDIGFEDAVVNLDSPVFVNYVNNALYYPKHCIKPETFLICEQIKIAHNKMLVNQQRWSEIESGGLL